MRESIPVRRQAVNLPVLLTLTTDQMHHQAAALGISLGVQLDDDVPEFVERDRDKVAWALTSLVGTALRHVSRPRGAVQVRVSYDRPPGCLLFTVKDNGLGIAPERLRRLLQRDEWHPGGALALLLVEDIAVAHGGRLQVESDTRSSSQFTSITFTIATSRRVEPMATRQHV
jgi:signal transduction histidine kinase